MSLRSMTGFGAGTARGGGMRVRVELSSVNRKNFDLRLSLPAEFRALQAELQGMIGDRIDRGAAECRVEVEWSQEAKSKTVAIDEALAGAYCESLRDAARKLGLSGDLPLRILLDLPGVVAAGPPEIDLDQVREVLGRALATALKRFDRMRRREGAALRKDLAERFQTLQSLARRIRRQAPAAAENHRRELARRLEEAGLAVEQDERIQRELVLYADKSDISEELTRLESHFEQARAFMKSGRPAGRALDFLAQELLREINTIASKSTDAIIAAASIEFKSELERVREQVRNVE